MNRKEAAELSPFIKAFGEGRIIEFSSITDVSKAWREVTDFPIGMIKNFKFRIKPEPKYCSPVMRYTSDIRQSLIELSQALVCSSLQLPSATRSTASSGPVAKSTLRSSFSSSLSPFPSKAIFRAVCNS